MTLPKNIRNEIIECLMPLHPQKVILFGSFAYGTPHQDSDIDLLVVTKDDFIPMNFKERMQVVLNVSQAMRNLRKKVPIDLIVHTKAMHLKFIEIGSLFAKEVLSKGIPII